MSNCVLWLGRQVVGVIVSVLTNVDYQIVCIDSRNVSSKIILLANLLRSNVMTFVFLMVFSFLKYLALLRLRNRVDLKLGVVEVLGIIRIDWAVPLVGLGAPFSSHATHLTPSAQDTLRQYFGRPLLHAQQTCFRFHIYYVGVDTVAVKRTEARVHDTWGLPVACRSIFVGLHKNIQIFGQFLSGHGKVRRIVLIWF